MRTKKDLMLEGGVILRDILEELQQQIKPGAVRRDIDLLAGKLLKKHKVMSAPALQGFPGNVSISIDTEVIQGLPDDAVFSEGDLVSIDLSILHNGLFVDKARSFTLDPSHFSKRYLCNAARQCFERALNYVNSSVGKGVYPTAGAIGKTIEDHARYLKVIPVRELYGHGIGEEPHMVPLIPNVYESANTTTIKRDTAISIEPIVFYGDSYNLRYINRFTAVSDVLSAHWEDTIWIGKSSAEVIT